MAYVDVDRRFRRLTEQELAHPELLPGWDLYGGNDAMGWRDLVSNPRVVLLAEAGAGKTEELRRMRDLLREEGKHAFFIEIESLSRASLRDALSQPEEQALDAWLADAGTQAWFFLDSVDELKLTQGRFDRALRSFAKGVNGLLERVSIVVSCRPNDWRPEADMQTLTELLPRHVPQQASISPEDAFFELLEHGDANRQDPGERRQQIPFLTVALVPLSDKQVREFVRHLTPYSDAFVQEVERQHAWDFARRPLDLLELVALWASSGRLGTRLEQHEANVDAKLRERSGRPDNAMLSPQDAVEGAERLALALALTRTRAIRTPDQPLGRDRSAAVLDAADILTDWSEAKVLALLRRGLFDPATYGRVRFHHRSVQEFLAARRLVALRQRGMPAKSLFRLLFAQTHGTRVLIPSMRPIAAWVALWQEDVRREVIAREPEIMLSLGDPESLALPVRREILRAFVNAYGTGGWRGINVPIDEVRRLATPALEPYILELWPRAKANEDARELLLELLWKSGGTACLEIARQAAFERSYSAYHRLLAIQTLLANGQREDLCALAQDLLTTGGGWPQRSIATVASTLFPSVLDVDQLVQLAANTPEAPSSTQGFHWQMKRICQDIALGPDAERLRHLLTAVIEDGAAPESTVYQPISTRAHLSSALRALCVRQFSASAWGDIADFAHACVISHRYRGNPDASSSGALAKLLRNAAGRVRQIVFWQEVSFAQKFERNDTWALVFSALHGSPLGGLDAADRGWLLEDLRSRTPDLEREVALIALLWIWRAADKDTTELDTLRSECAGNERQLALVHEVTAPSPHAESLLEHERTRAQRTAERELKEELRLLEWDAWRQEVLADPARAFNDTYRRQNTEDVMIWLTGGQFPRSGAWDRPRIVRAFSEDVALLLEQALTEYWRNVDPPLPSERPRSERSSFQMRWMIGLTGLHIESRSRGWAQRLTSSEARLAARQSTLELDGFAEWLPDLAQAQPQIVQEVLGRELRAQVEEARDTESIWLLQTVSHADTLIKKLLYGVCKEIFLQWDPGERRLQQAPYYVEQLLTALADNIPEPDRPMLAQLCEQRLKAAPPGALRTTWLRALFMLDASAGVAELATILAGEGDEAVSVLAALFGRQSDHGVLTVRSTDMAVVALGRLIRAAYRAVPPQSDPQHEGVYTPKVRDYAAQARSYLLSALVSTPGRAARDELVALARDPLLTDLQERLQLLARERAASDSEFEALQAGDVQALEARLEAAPKTRDALHALMMDRLDDLQHDIAHHAFSDRKTLQSISEEEQMQHTLAMRLESNARQNYTVTRESEVADAKRTDIVLAAAGSLQKAVIEIKIADVRWTLADLEKALTQQLVQLYERHDNCRSGCLLITNNGGRAFWAKRGLRLDWGGLLRHLGTLAESVEAQRPELRVSVFGLDLRVPPLTR